MITPFEIDSATVEGRLIPVGTRSESGGPEAAQLPDRHRPRVVPDRRQFDFAVR
ncbi:MAG: hypothetical protein V9F03_05705 [Microthrixaceae bacterium]